MTQVELDELELAVITDALGFYADVQRDCGEEVPALRAEITLRYIESVQTS